LLAVAPRQEARPGQAGPVVVVADRWLRTSRLARRADHHARHQGRPPEPVGRRDRAVRRGRPAGRALAASRGVDPARRPEGREEEGRAVQHRPRAGAVPDQRSGPCRGVVRGDQPARDRLVRLAPAGRHGRPGRGRRRSGAARVARVAGPRDRLRARVQPAVVVRPATGADPVDVDRRRRRRDRRRPRPRVRGRALPRLRRARRGGGPPGRPAHGVPAPAGRAHRGASQRHPWQRAGDRLMLTIEVELLHGTIRAGESNDLAMTGADSRGEWPPSPARLVAALVAGDGTRDRCRVTDGTELRVLERAAPPIIHADPTDDVARSRLRERFVVVNDKAKSAVQEYPGRTNGVERPGTRLSPGRPRLAYVWPDVEVGEDATAALRSRAARVGYLGCADSPVRLRVHDGPPSSAPATTWRPDPSGEATLPVPFDGYVEVLDAAYDMFTAGTSARRSWFRSEHARYASPTPTSVASPSREGTMVALRFERPVSGRRVLTVTETLREAVLDLYQRLVAAEGEELPAVLHGHATPVGSQHAHFLALPD